MDDLFLRPVSWLPSSIISLTTTDDHTVVLHSALLKFRWPLFAQDPEAALEVARSLTLSELKSVLLFIYSNLPARRSLLAVFDRCQLVQPQALQESSFVVDMRNLMKDSESCDFALESADGERFLVHRAILCARSKYFKSLFLCPGSESVSGVWKCVRPIPGPSLHFFREYLYTGQIESPSSLHLIPLCWMVKYLKMSGDREVENILVASMTRDLNDESRTEFAEAAAFWGAKCAVEVIEKYNATRR
jgi:hypothetical protein